MSQSNNIPSEKVLYDVAILGSGLAGSLLAAILARHGAKVLVLDADTHPRFAVGESTIPYTSVMMRTVARRYDVPEIAYLSSFHGVQKHVSTACGVKRNFGFVYHREGQEQDQSEVNQFVIPKILHSESHFFRQDVDAYMLHVAVTYGAAIRQQVRVTHVDFDGTGATLHLDKGGTYRARYVVDGSGYRSPIATQLGLRENPPRQKHHCRSLFTHMVRVPAYDDIAPTPPRQYQNPSRWNEGTLHHLFEGGWIWVIPFDNHRGSRNALCSVGLSIDPRVHPQPEGVTPEEEFRAFIARFPAIERHLKGGVSVREWVSTGRLQYSSSSMVGDRYCLTSHAAGFVDALFSRGLTNTLEVVNALGYRLLAAIKDDDFSAQRFEYIERMQQGLLYLNDELVYLSYVSFKDFPMWNASFRVWALGAVLSTFVLQCAYAKYCSTGDDGVLRALENTPTPGITLPDHPGYPHLVESTVAEAEMVVAGNKTPAAAADSIFQVLQSAEFIPPAFGYHIPATRFYHPTPLKVAKTLVWSKRTAPPAIGRTVRGALSGFIKAKLHGG